MQEKLSNYFDNFKRSFNETFESYVGSQPTTLQTTVVFTGAGLLVSVTSYALYKYATIPRPPRKGKYPKSTLPSDAYDALIVGGGPSGATCAYYAVKGGAKVCVLDKETFPRDKYCGDAVCTPALNILDDMNVLKEIKDNNEVQFADVGGLISPFGLAFIGKSKERLGTPAAGAIKRIHLDDRIIKNSVKAGAELKQFFVKDAKFDQEKGLWTVTNAEGQTVQGRTLIIGDGATSTLATKLGYCVERAKGVCSRAYVKGGTHNCNFDGVCFYPVKSLPGYCAIFRHPNDELNFCYYLIPQGKDGWCGKVREEDLKELHNGAISSDPFISKALGPQADIERMKAASLRLGGQGLTTTYDDHLLIIGDAAGHCDPLSGEGIHTSMQGGQIAGVVLADMVKTGDFTKKSTVMYQYLWQKEFGYDFSLSKAFASFLYRFPIVLDACVHDMQRKGDKQILVWAEVMTGLKPKSNMFNPSISVPLGISVIREIIDQKILGKKNQYC